MAKYLTAMNPRESTLWALGSQGSSSLLRWPLQDFLNRNLILIFLKLSDHGQRWKKEADTEGPRAVGRGHQADFLDLKSLQIVS